MRASDTGDAPGRFERLFVIAAIILFSGPTYPLILWRGQDLTAEGDAILRLPFLAVFIVTGVLVALRWQGFLRVVKACPLIVALTALALLSAIWSLDPGVSLRRAVSVAGATSFGFYVASRFSLEEILGLLVRAMLAIILAMLVFTALFPDIAIMQAPHDGAWRGLHPHKNGLGRFLVWCLAVAAASLIAYPGRRLPILGWIGVALGIVVLSHSATSLVVSLLVLAAPVGLGLLRIDRRAAASIACAAAAFAILPLALVAANPGVVLEMLGRDSTLTGRTGIWSEVSGHIMDRLLFGHGYQVFWQENLLSMEETLVDAQVGEGIERITNSHNGWIELLLDLGLVGFTLMAAALTVTFLQALRAGQRGETAMSVAPLLLLVPLIPLSLAEASLLSQNDVVWVMYCIVAGHLAVHRHAPSRPSFLGEQPPSTKLFPILRRHIVLIVVATAGFFTLLGAMVISQPERYLSAATLLVDIKPRQFLQADARQFPRNSTREQSVVQSEIDILKSDTLARQVIDRLHLADQPAFMQDGGASARVISATLTQIATGFNRAYAIMRGEAHPETAAATAADSHFMTVLRFYKGRLVIGNAVTGYTVSLGFRHEDPVMAAQIANAHAAAYLENQTAFKQQIARQTGQALQDTLTELRPRLQDAGRRMMLERAMAGRSGPEPVTLELDRLAELNKLLSLAKALRLDLQARFDEARKALEGGPQALSEAIASPMIGGLREQQADLGKTKAPALAQLGDRHPQLADIRDQDAILENRIDAEASRLVVALGSELETAKLHEQALAAAVNRAQGLGYQEDAAGARIGVLYREAEAVGRVFDGVLARFTQVSTQNAEQWSNGHIVSPAPIPIDPEPLDKRALITATLAISVLLSLSMAFGAEWLSPGYHGAREIEEDIGLPVLASIPRDLADSAGNRLQEKVVVAPQSLAAESIRGLRVALSRRAGGDRPQVVVVTSCLPGEGRSTVAAAVARSLAMTAKRGVVLIDCDPSGSGHTDANQQGIATVFRDPDLLEGALRTDPLSTLRFLPAGHDEGDFADMVSTQGLNGVIARLRPIPDWIVVDGPPLTAVASGIMQILPAATCMLVVVRFARTPKDLLRAYMRRAPQSWRDRIFLVMNDVATGRKAAFTPNDPEYYSRLVSSYYR
jgi:uncharacterized protein involved in exopolysaccharide biosynthesis/O-antigen ligase/Mrp family chromosome partitioning ATPase